MRDSLAAKKGSQLAFMPSAMNGAGLFYCRSRVPFLGTPVLSRSGGAVLNMGTAVQTR